MDGISFHMELFTMAASQHAPICCGPEKQERRHKLMFTVEEKNSDKLNKLNVN